MRKRQRKKNFKKRLNAMIALVQGEILRSQLHRSHRIYKDGGVVTGNPMSGERVSINMAQNTYGIDLKNLNDPGRIKIICDREMKEKE